MATWLVIGISGVTCGGKSTLAQSLHEQFNKMSHSSTFNNIFIKGVEVINQDDYFLPENHPNHKLIKELNHFNWDIPTALDMLKMQEDVIQILGPNYKSYHVKQIKDDLIINSSKILSRSSPIIDCKKVNGFPVFLNILIIEGTLIFNSFIKDLCCLKFHIHLPYEKCYARRSNRIYEPADIVGYFEMCVWPMYEKHFKDFKDDNDVFILNGDVSKDQLFRYVFKCIEDSV